VLNIAIFGGKYKLNVTQLEKLSRFIIKISEYKNNSSQIIIISLFRRNKKNKLK